MAAAATLESREMPPARAPETPVEVNPEVNLTYTGNTGNDMGISTMGFRSAKYNVSEWHESNYAKYYQAFVDRDHSERLRHEGDVTMKEIGTRTEVTQDGVTKKLEERCKDIEFWKLELEREIRDLTAETGLLIAMKRRFENALRATEIPLHIVTDNLNCRQRRQGVDLVQDDVEISLLKEVEIINSVRDLLQNTIAQIEKQIRLNRDAKTCLEFDWSDKKEAHEIETINAALRNWHTNKQFHDGAALFQEIMSTPQSWVAWTHDNIARAEHERMASIQLRTMGDNILEDTSRDMTEQHDTAMASFEKRIREYEDALAKLQAQNLKVVGEIARQEKNIDDLKAAIRALEDPLKKAQTRLYNRSHRPRVDLCRDEPQYALIGEVNEIQQSMDTLKNQLNQAEASLKDLQDNRMALEKEIAVKKNSIFIDKEKCLAVRTRYPTRERLLGYQDNILFASSPLSYTYTFT